MNVRKLGTSMVTVGAVAAVTGLVARGIQLSNEAGRPRRSGVLDLSCFWCSVFYGGLVLVVLGVTLMLCARLYESPDRRVVPERRLLQVAVPAAVVVLAIAGAVALADSPLGEPTGTSPGTALIAQQSVASNASNATGAAAGHAHNHGAATDAAGATTSAAGHSHGAVIPGSATGDSPCEIAIDNKDAEGSLHGERGVQVQQVLGATERATLEAQMRAARTVVDQFPTVAAAEAAGYHKSTAYVPCIGAHYTNVGKVAVFDPAAPSELLYGGTDPDSKIVGLSYLVYHRGGPPDGFAGPNDHWHQHNDNGGLCMKGGVVIGGESVTEKECEARGGRKQALDDIWMVHAWVVPGNANPWGLFADGIPALA